jgi:DNA polymerase-3 subunit epsilon
MKRPAYDTIKRSMVLAGVLAAAGAVLLAPSILTDRAVPLSVQVLAAVCAVLAGFLLAAGWRAAHRFGLGIERLRSAVLNLVADRDASLPENLPAGTPGEILAMLESLAAYQGEVVRDRNAPDQRLVAVLGALSSGVVVVTDQGQVSLLNHAARDLLGAARARVGTSVFAALDRKSVLRTIEKAGKADRPVEGVFERLDGVELQARVSPLPGGEGAVIIFPPVELDRHRPGVEFDLELHDVPPPRGDLSLDTPLDELPILVLDTETTGLDVREDRIVSVGAVAAHGARLFRGRMIDDLVDPGVPIPPASTAVHGITDPMVADARDFPAVYADLDRMAKGRVVIGHNVPFDLTIMREECARHGRPWEQPVFIDTLRLASLLNPALDRLDLETLADIYNIDVHGRHTALGDALVAAELFFGMMPRLQMQGFRTLGDLLEYHCRAAVDVIAGQRESGWITTQPESLRGGGVDRRGG